MALRIALVVCLIALCIFTAAETQLQNYTILAPAGATDHGDPRDFCLPAGVLDYLLFYFGNYIAHAATVVTYPGEKKRLTFLTIIFSLLFPATGVNKALGAIFRHARFPRPGSYAGEQKLDKLRCAARAGALCMLVRSEHWLPTDGDVVRDIVVATSGDALNTLYGKPNANPEARELEEGLVGPASKEVGQPAQSYELSRLSHSLELATTTDHSSPLQSPINNSMVLVKCDSTARPNLKRTKSTLSEMWKPIDPRMVDTNARQIHGNHKIPPGYDFWYVPNDAEVFSIAEGTGNPNIIDSIEELAVSYDGPKALIAIVQTVYAAITLYRTRGNQIIHYGYAAFGLTVAPYLVMSIVNFIANLVTPSYSALYLVRNDVMREAEQRVGIFDGVVGQIEPATPQTPRQCQGSSTFQKAAQAAESGGFLAQVIYLLRPGQRTNLSPNPTIKKNAKALGLSMPVERGNRTERAGPGLEEPSHSSIKRSAKRPSYYSSQREVGISYLVYLIAGTPIIIIGALSGFQTGSSSIAQRAWTMIWLVFGIVFGPTIHVFLRSLKSGTIGELLLLSSVLAYAVPAIGGMVVVGQMLSEFGVCTRLY